MTVEILNDLQANEPNEQNVRERTHKVDWILVAIIGLLVQGFWVGLVTQPSYMDAFYYATNGQQLAAGKGFNELIIWQFLDDPAGLPMPSHTYWMPLPSILAALGYTLRDDFTGAQLFFWLLGGLLPLLAFVISWQLVGQRWQAWVAALFAAVGGFYAAFLGQPSTFAPFAWAGGLCLLALGLATRYRRNIVREVPSSKDKTVNKKALWWFVAGLTAGLAHLTRADGLLLLLVALFTWAIEIRSSLLEKGGREQVTARRQSVRFDKPVLFLIVLLLGYLLIMGWWFIRNWSVMGQPLSAAGAQSMFLTSYDDLFAYGRVNDWQTFLDWGWSNILLSRLQGTWVALQTFVAVPGLIFMVPFILVAIFRLYRRPPTRMMLRPPLIYAVALFFSGAILFTFPGMRGSLFHSSIALWPWSTSLTAAGIGLAVDKAATRLSHWQPHRAKRIFSGLFIIIALIITLFVSQFRLAPAEDPEIYRQVGRLVSSSSVVMVGNAPALHYYTGLSAISVPNEPVEVMLQAADRFGVTYVLLTEDRPQPLDDIYQGNDRHPRLQLIWTSDQAKLYELSPVPE